MKKRIVVDTSTGCLDYYEHNYDIRTIRIKIDLNDKLLDDGSDITADYFYDLISTNTNLLPKTSQPSRGSILKFFENLHLEGFEEAIVITISSKLSGTINAIKQIATMLEDKINIIPFDSKTVCFSEGMFAIEAAKMIEEGISTNQIIEKLNYMRLNNRIMFAVDSLEYLVKNGRLSGAQGFIGKYLKIKPILEVVEDGTIQAVEKIRTTKKALEGIINRIIDYTKDHNKYYLYIATTLANGYLEEFLKELLKEKLGLENVDVRPSTPVVGCHIGPYAIGVGIFLID